ncbi:V-set and transmembrane domain-containing protein 4a [Chanos chanos]|uniref:V-set and transmembrane domain-containing protein 4a n=1 Tax=Chanos chanos TaxID=29144 RepID=A0A6J2V9U8_CHACN|nr:V-set and transmembrane domain-containing protein 4 [Chanos chanos]
MKLSSVVIVFLIRAFIGEVSIALNVTVTPGPVSVCTEGDNITLSCLVSQKKRMSSVLVLRWLFSQGPDVEHLLVKINVKRAKYYGNYSRRFPQPKFHLTEEKKEKVYNLLILNVSKEDRGNYTCRVQEIRRYHNRWRASSNGTGRVELKVHHLPVTDSSDGIWRLFQDLYLCAVLICSIGLICIFLFTVVIACQSIQRKHRQRASYYLVKCPENSSGETVTSVVSSSPGMHRKEKRHKHQPKHSVDQPPEIPAKAPIADKPRKPKLLKTQPRKVTAPRVVEDSLTYAELELVRPKPETKACCTGTVYAQILFLDKKV